MIVLGIVVAILSIIIIINKTYIIIKERELTSFWLYYLSTISVIYFLEQIIKLIDKL